MDESEVIEFGSVRDGVAKSAEAEAAMTPLGESALTLGVDVLSAARGRLKSRLLLRNSDQKCGRSVPSQFDVLIANSADQKLQEEGFT